MESLASELVRRFPESPHLATAHLVQARLLLARGQHAAAEPLLAGLIAAAEDPRPQLRYYLALAQVGQRKFEQALDSLASIDAAESPLVPLVREVRTAALLGLKRYGEAEPLLREQIGATTGAAATSLRCQWIGALAEQGKLDEAAQELAQIPESSLAEPGVAAAALRIAERAFQGGDLPLAHNIFTRLAQDGVPAPVRAQALSGLAWTQLRRDGNEASSETFERVLAEYPESPLAAEAALLRGRTLEDDRQLDAALTAYRLVIDRYSDSPQLPAALLAAGRLHEKRDQLREAAELLERLIALPDAAPELGAALYTLAWVRIDLDRPAEADALFARISDELPASAYWSDATYRLAERAARSKHTDRAVALADRLIAADQCDAPIREHALYLRGQVAATASKWKQVARCMEQLVSEYPTSKLRLSAEYWQAEADYRDGQYSAAAERLERLASESAGRQKTWLPMIPLRRAQCLAHEKEWTEALAMAEAIAAEHPQFDHQHEADYLIGRCLGSLGRLEEARVAYRRAALSPQASQTETAALAQWMIGETFFHQRRYDEAVAAYELCARGKFPRWQAAALLQAGKCRLLLGQRDQAIASFERVVGELPDTPYSGEARQRLSALGATASATASKPRTSTLTE